MFNLSDILHGIQAGETGLAQFTVSIVFSLLLGTLCMWLYRLYFEAVSDRNESLARSFVVIAPSVSAIFWAVQYSLPLSLGLLGAMSFVRFRTPIKRSEDIAFILLVIALSLLSSVYRFYAAAVVLGVVVLVILVREAVRNRLFGRNRNEKGITAFVSIPASANITDIDAKIREAFGKLSANMADADIRLHDVVPVDGGYNLSYRLLFRRFDDALIPKIYEALHGHAGGDGRVEIVHERSTY